MSKEDEAPAVEVAAGESLVPETDKAVRDAYNLYDNWLRRVLGDDLNGKQIRAAAVTALQIIVPTVRAAAMLDLAAALDLSPEIPDLMGDALREAAKAALARDWGVDRVGG